MINILSPKSGQNIQGSDVELIVATPNYKIVDFEKYTKAVTGQGHLHIWVDQDNYSKTSAIKASSNVYKLTNFAPGPHTVVVELVANNHASYVPKNISSVSFITAPTIPEPKKLQSPLILTLITLILMLVATFLMLSKPQVAKKSKK